MDNEIIKNTGKKLDKPGMHLYFREIYSKEYKATLGYQSQLYLVDEKEGILTPDNYLYVAETTDQCLRLVVWQIEAICRLMEGFEKKNIEYDWISVEVPVAAIDRIDFADKVLERIKENKINPAKFAFSLQVNVLEQNSETIRENIRTLKEAGAVIIIKGYGVMYSAVMDLCNIEADYCTIDRSLTPYINGTEKEQKMYANLINIIRDMDMEPITEGLDTKTVTDQWMENCSALIGEGNKFGTWMDEDKLEVDRRKVRYQD